FISKRYKNKKKIFIIITIFINIIYLTWRFIFTLPDDEIIGKVVGIILLLAEIVGFCQSLVFRLVFWKPYKLEKNLLMNLKNCLQ
ncbi:hypothetical protein KUA25_23890, partial [Bacteroidales bacterium MSK.15.36]|nr:hypothetical protein [Bacteroidales bacterium MSK.15.36]